MQDKKKTWDDNQKSQAASPSESHDCCDSHNKDASCYMPDDHENPEIHEAACCAPSNNIDHYQTQIADLSDKLLRSLADMENLRRRTEREVQESRIYAMTAFARDIVSVGDSLDRALESLAQADNSGSDSIFQTLIDGIEMTRQELMKVFAKYHIYPLDAQGERFDPNLHQALFEIERTDVDSGTIVQTVQRGYRIQDRILRPAMVGVSKGGSDTPRPSPREG